MGFDVVGWVVLAAILYAASLLFDAVESHIPPLKNASKPITALCFLGFLALITAVCAKVLHLTLPPEAATIIPDQIKTLVMGVLTALIYAHGGAAAKNTDG